MKITVYDLLPGETCFCLYCSNEYLPDGSYGPRAYHRGEAFLCGPEHPPYDANANYFCEIHLDAAVVSIYDPLTHTERPRAQALTPPISTAEFI